MRLNGTGSVSWPSGRLAASADLDAAEGYRLLAMFDGEAAAPSVALSVDASGGFAQAASGETAASWKRGGGTGRWAHMHLCVWGGASM